MGKKKKFPDKTANKHHKEIPAKLTTSNEQTQESCDGHTSKLVWTGFGVYGVFLVTVYVYTMYPTIMGGDSGELMAAAQELGVAHPPGYPLFTLMSWLAIQIVPVEDVAWKCNLLNAVMSALAGLVLALTIYRYTGNVGCAVGGSSAWCFCNLTWTWAASAEVFGLNNLFTVSLIYLMAVFQDAEEKKKPKVACLGAFVCGLSLTNQHTLVVYVAFIALWVLLELYSNKLLKFRLLIQVGVCFSLGLLPYVYLPLSAYFSNGRWTWGDQTTIDGFLKHFFRTEYGTFDLAKENSTDVPLLKNLSPYGWHTVEEFSVVSLVLFMLGVKEALDRARRQKKRSLFVVLVMMLVYLVFFSWRANLDIANPLLLGVVKRFWMQADCVYMLLAAVGAAYLHRLIRPKVMHVEKPVLLLGVGLAVCAWQLQRNFSECNQRNSRVVEEFGLRILENVPPNSLIFTKGDLPSNVFRYLYLSTNHRPDVTVFDQEILTFYWSVPMLAKAYPRLVFPGDRMELITGYIRGTNIKVFNSRTFLDANINRFPIIGCIGMQDHDMSWQEGYDLVPFGPCKWIHKKGADLDLDFIIKKGLNISHGWQHPYKGFDETSWDRVATDEIWDAKTSIGLYLYISATAMTEDTPTRTVFVVKSYQIYTNAINDIAIEAVPSYWHKNYGLVCDRMLAVDHDHSYLELARKAVLHFQLYLQAEPGDKDARAIESEIDRIAGIVAQLETEARATDKA